ncbi:CRISPR-associated helicase Cas3' [Infirmifilum lucidum]|uniref:CRISPR-associated helicase Cas3 n=1 Tax=Infirmifilum lucidum TaxID=2776706 RepID=A0A7L9FIS6_9CREN|nr:CRISPR-associated helicase Cas3' [Infirmifilum lucidum]QOJ78824.1 CRISPR-associated helicase Cas3' [Infirmifilum lucidum]
MAPGNFLLESYRLVERAARREGDARRPLLERFFEEAARRLEESGDGRKREGRAFLAVVNAPTGYGKTSLSLASAAASALDASLFPKVIHVLPLRSIVEDVAGRAGALLGPHAVGVKMMGVSVEVFHTYPLNVTTVDTFTFDLLKLNTKKLRRIRAGEEFGYDFLTQASILNSLVVLDEAHYALEEEYMRDVFYLVLDFLLSVKVPVVVMTATLSRGYEELLRALAESRGVDYFRLEPDASDPYVVEQARKDVRVEFMSEEEALGAARSQEIVERGRVLVVANNPYRATCIFERLSRRGLKALLLHGKMTPSHKKRVLGLVEEMERRGESFVLVATQVVEAGVDVSFDTLVTDPAPAYSLIQRAGRVARRPAERSGRIIVVEDGPAEPYDRVKVLRTLEWLEENRDVFNPRVPGTYSDLLARVHGSRSTEVLPGSSRLSGVKLELFDPLSRSFDVFEEVVEIVKREPFLREFNLPVEVGGETVLLTPREAYDLYERGLLRVGGDGLEGEEPGDGRKEGIDFYELAKQVALGKDVRLEFAGSYDPVRGLAECRAIDDEKGSRDNRKGRGS